MYGSVSRGFERLESDGFHHLDPPPLRNGPGSKRCSPTRVTDSVRHAQTSARHTHASFIECWTHLHEC